MSLSARCDRCKIHFEIDDVQQVDYYQADIGRFYTLHLYKAKCFKAFGEFMIGLRIEAL